MNLALSDQIYRSEHRFTQKMSRQQSSEVDCMELRILYDNEAKTGFKKGWGFSCLVGDRFLFDTGADVNTLLFNMNRFHVKFERIDNVVLSHEHGDHVGGFQILRKLGKVEVCVPRSFSSQFKRRLASYHNVSLTEVGEAREISERFFTTGELGSTIREQSLIVETDKGLTVVTGCSHPGLEKILDKASHFGKIYGVVGGFHGFSRLEALEGVSLIVPCHCTTRKREILRAYSRSSKKCATGCVIEIP